MRLKNYTNKERNNFITELANEPSPWVFASVLENIASNEKDIYTVSGQKPVTNERVKVKKVFVNSTPLIAALRSSNDLTFYSLTAAARYLKINTVRGNPHFCNYQVALDESYNSLMNYLGQRALNE